MALISKTELCKLVGFSGDMHLNGDYIDAEAVVLINTCIINMCDMDLAKNFVVLILLRVEKYWELVRLSPSISTHFQIQTTPPLLFMTKQLSYKQVYPSIGLQSTVLLGIGWGHPKFNL